MLAALMLLPLFGCVKTPQSAEVVATTGPVCQFTRLLLEGTGITVTQLVTESVSCLHDYSMTVEQARCIENARVIIVSGGGLEDFLAIGEDKTLIDSSLNMPYLACEEHDHDHGHDHAHSHDPHFWLSPEHAMIMSRNIHNGLQAQFPGHEALLRENLQQLLTSLEALERYGREQLSALSCRELITFHDGFGYFAAAFDLTVLESIEEEAGSEASAQMLVELIGLVREHALPAIFTELNGSRRAADIIAGETGVRVLALDMAMTGDYFAAMYRNIDTIKEALG